MLVLVVSALVSGVLMYSMSALPQPELAALKPQDRGKVAGAETQGYYVQLVIDDGNDITNQNISPVPGQTALQTLERAAKLKSFAYETKSYSTGVLIESINGQKNGTNNKYWILYVNGESAQVGADQQLVQAGDKIEFRFQESIF